VSIERKTGSCAERSSSVSRNQFGGLRSQRISISLALSLAALSTTAPAWAEQGTTTLGLRGSTNAYSNGTEAAPAMTLRGASHQSETIIYESDGEVEHRFEEDETPTVIVADENEDHQYPADETAMQDVGHALHFLRRNFVPTLLFRGPKRAISDRTVSYTIPPRASLRHSMLHSANLYDGMRGAEASIGDTIALALRGSYSSRAQIERAAADRARVHGALANFLPKVSGTLTATHTSEEGSMSYGDRIEQVSAGIEVSMPLYTSGVNVNTYRQAKHVSLASDLSYLAEEYRVALEAIAAHINLRLNRRIEKTLKSNVSAMKRIAHIAGKLYEAGDASRTDIAIARANVESARAEVDLAQKTREETLSDYESFTGSSAPSKLLAPNFRVLVPHSVDMAVEMALANNPTLNSSLHTAMASDYAAKVERGKYGPKVDLFGSYNEPLHSSSTTEQVGDWNIGVRLKMPLLDATRAPSVGAARHDALEAQYRALEQSRIVERQIRRQWTAYKSAERRVTIVKRQVRAVAASVEGARREYEAGFRSISDVLNDQVKLARARITLESARHEQMLAAYEIAFTTANPAVRRLAGAGSRYQ
jgi:outer membrane protein